MSQSNRERVDRELERLNRSLKPFIVGQMSRLYGASWHQEALKSLRDPHWTNRGDLHLDEQALLNILRDQWERIFHQMPSPAEREIIKELIGVRNKWAHRRGVITATDVERLLKNMEHLLTWIDPYDSSSRLKFKQASTTRPNPMSDQKAEQSDGVLQATVSISQAEAVVGTMRSLTLPGGRQVSVSVPAGVQDGSMLRLKPSQGDPAGPVVVLTIRIVSVELAQAIFRESIVPTFSVSPPTVPSLSAPETSSSRYKSNKTPSMRCDYADCANPISRRCHHCGGSYCVRHIALEAYGQNICELCASDRKRKISRNLLVARIVFIGGSGLLGGLFLILDGLAAVGSCLFLFSILCLVIVLVRQHD